MTEISHLQFGAHLKKTPTPFVAVYLIHGESTLVEQALESLVVFLLQGAAREIHCESVVGLVENIPDLLAEMNTFSLLSGPKVMLFKDAKLFETRTDQQRLVDQIQEAIAADRTEVAAKAMLGLCRQSGLAPEKITPGPQVHPDLLTVQDAIGEEGLQLLIRLCRDKGWTIDPGADPLVALGAALEKGFPSRHFLVITVNSKVPKNRKLYKTILNQGWIVDCTVPLGERKADKTVQQTVLRQTMAEMLTAGGKKMAPALFAKLTAATGFDLPVFIQSMDKLMAYAGDRREITAGDVDALVRRTKTDPVFELTKAVAERQAAQAVAQLQGLLRTGWHPLQILSAIANQVRKLMVAKDFCASQYGRAWTPGLSYSQFQETVLPAIKAFDEDVARQISGWQAENTAAQPSKKKKAVKSGFDLALAANPNNAYPIYQTLLKSDNYSLGELIQALLRMNQVDVRLKSTGQDPTVMLTSLLLSICHGPRSVSMRRRHLGQ